MVKGKKCPSCKLPLYAQDEDYQPKGTYVTYVCRNNQAKCSHREKVFEGN